MRSFVDRRTRRTLAITAAFTCSLLLHPSDPVSADSKGTGNCTRTSVGTTALTDLASSTYRGVPGGLYPGGSNSLPQTYRTTGLSAASLVRPLSRTGAPSALGKIAFLSIGMSNTYLEFSAFSSLATTDGAVDRRIVFVNGAQPGADATRFAQANSSSWTNLDQAIVDKGVTANQVQVIWLKEAIANETRAFPTDATALRDDLRTIIGIARSRFPNLRLVYLASRTYAGYATVPLNPEPYAYESGFAVKWLIQQDIATPAEERPWIAWGPYFWTNGTVGRSDGFVWTCADVRSDGTHPSLVGSSKLAQLLLTFFETSATTRSWFNTPAAPSPSPSPTATK
jgi:hypothetical protein